MSATGRVLSLVSGNYVSRQSKAGIVPPVQFQPIGVSRKMCTTHCSNLSIQPSWSLKSPLSNLGMQIALDPFRSASCSSGPVWNFRGSSSGNVMAPIEA